MKRRLTFLWSASVLFFLSCALFLPKALTASTSGERLLPIYSVETEDPVVALTFDGAWGNEDLADILATLTESDVRATFFLTGDWVRQYPEDAKAIAAAGHDIGSHGDTHLDLAGKSADTIRRELDGAYEAVFQVTGIKMDLFRPPYGSYDNTVIQTATGCGYYAIQWSVDSLDWKDYGVTDILDRCLHHKKLENGAILLLHNGARYTAAALPDLIRGLKEQGYSFLPVSALIHRDSYRIDHTGRQIPTS